MNSSNIRVDFEKGPLFSDGYVRGNSLFISGQQGLNANENFPGTDISLRTANAIAAVQTIVEDAGFEMSDLVSVTVYLTDLEEVPKINEVYKRLIPDPKPARAAVQVAGLIGGAKIEIAAIAVKRS
jgi:2-iminobutanoate/2-iminopropanoate deaminase